MKTIWKYDLTGKLNATHEGGPHKFSLNMPKNAKVICLRNDFDNIPCMWFEFKKFSSTKMRDFYSIGTGWGTVPNDYIYLGTVFEHNKYVWHIYEAKKCLILMPQTTFYRGEYGNRKAL